ncbi:MAG TPA: class D sortase [Candidatus Dormibacteraeota bacterium]|nr:class D sortase [Candidatus Dormibacteraeota bacterium]
MELRLRTVGRGNTRPTGGATRRSLVAALVIVSATLLVAGTTMLGIAMAPAFTPRAEAVGAVGRAQLALPTTSPAPSPASRAFGPPLPAAPYPSDLPVDGVSFVLRVPVVGYSATVHEGVTPAVLSKGPGHYPTTSWPGRPGNIGVAAHNSAWLSFGRLKAGDRVEIRTEHALYVYEITGSRIVDADDRTVLAQTADNRLTLTTCYPLWAPVTPPDRIVFTAREIGAVA